MDIEELKALMEEAGWSQRKLAKKTGLHFNTIHYMCIGKNFTASTYRKCYEALTRNILGLEADDETETEDIS